jgi:translation initiation factor IF-1
VEFPSGQQTLCLLPAKFNKKLWVKRGGFLIIESTPVDDDSRVTGSILSVLYDEDIQELKRVPGVW